MSHRIIRGLIWARPCPKPPFIPNSRPRGAKLQGTRYEKQIAKSFPEARHGQWFEFEDSNGTGWCQADFCIRRGEHTVVFEAKYTWTSAGHSQIQQLYRPVIEKVTGRPVVGVLVCKRLLPKTTGFITDSLEVAIDAALQYRNCTPITWHWLGNIAIGPLCASPRRGPIALQSAST